MGKEGDKASGRGDLTGLAIRLLFRTTFLGERLVCDKVKPSLPTLRFFDDSSFPASSDLFLFEGVGSGVSVSIESFSSLSLSALWPLIFHLLGLGGILPPLKNRSNVVCLASVGEDDDSCHFGTVDALGHSYKQRHVSMHGRLPGTGDKVWLDE